MKLKQYEVVSQPQYIKGNVQDIIKSHKTIKHWAYILHDKDDSSPHYHIYLNFGNTGVESEEVAKWFGLQESCVEKVKGRRTDMLLYLIHGNDSQQSKHQYDFNEVISNFDFKGEILQAQIIGNFEQYSYAQQIDFIQNKLPRSERKSAFSTLTALWKLHCQYLATQVDRHLEVMFITGKSGTGKTYYAKKLLKSIDYDFCISSGSTDPFQDYMGQRAIILDDFRDSYYENLFDLLKLLDNNTSSSINSRYSNKVFNGDLIIITSSVPLRYWYKNMRYNSDDSLTQLYRRIGSYVEVTDDTVTVYEEIDSFGKPLGLGKIYKNELVDIKKQERKKESAVALFDKICVPSTEDILNKKIPGSQG